MKLEQLFERSQDDAEKSIESLKKKLTDINAEISKIKSKGATLAHGVVSPQYKPHYDRLVAAKKDIQHQIKTEHERTGSTEKSREWKKDQQEKHDNPEEKKARQSKAMSSGMRSSSDLRKKHGDWEGLARHIGTLVSSATNKGQEKLSVEQVEQIANKLGVTARTIYNWMGRPEFRTIRRHLPREW